MQCRRCGKETGDSMYCSFCGYRNTEGNVREMTSTEKRFFNGVTIDAGGAVSSSNYRRRTRYAPKHGYTRGVTYNFGGLGISRFFGKLVKKFINPEVIARVAVTLIGVALSALLIVVALPIVFLILAIGIALFVTSSKFRR